MSPQYGPRALLSMFLLSLILIAAGCSRSGESDATDAGPPAGAAVGSAAADPDSAAAGDTLAAEALAAADTTAADSLAAADTTAVAPARGGFLSRLFGGSHDGDEEEEEEEAVPVELGQVLVRDIPSYLGTTATLEPEKEAQVLAKIDGEILGITCEEGDWVRQGQVLASLDGAVQRVSLDEAQARLHALELHLERIRAMHAEEFASDKDLLDAESQYEQAVAQHAAAQLQVEYTEIKAPFDGQIAERLVDQGQTVAPGAALFALVDREPLLACIHLPEKEAMKIAPGQEVMVSPDTDASLRIPGAVLRVSPVVDPRTGTVKITCHVSRPEVALRPGSFVRVQIETEVHRGVLAIPKRALVPEGADNYVFRAEADSVLKVRIKTGYANHEYIEVTEGLTTGERVVTVGHGALKTGTKVREIIPEAATVAAADSGQNWSE